MDWSGGRYWTQAEPDHGDDFWFTLGLGPVDAAADGPS